MFEIRLNNTFLLIYFDRIKKQDEINLIAFDFYLVSFVRNLEDSIRAQQIMLEILKIQFEHFINV